MPDYRDNRYRCLPLNLHVTMATQRGKRAPAPSMAAAPPSPLPPAAHSATTIELGSAAANNNNTDGGSPSKLSKSSIAVATVHRRCCGTGPFDKTWLNLDCCGLFCAAVTYGLHLYGCYAVVYILLPPWMSHIYDPDGTIISPTAPHVDGAVRRLSFWGWLHGLAFCCVAGMAIYSHYKAMTTDPGAVPPDAAPLPHPDDIVNGDEMAGLLESGRGRGGIGIGRTTGSAAADSVLGVNSKSGSATAAGAGVASTAAAAVVGGAVAVAAAPALMAGAAVAASLPTSSGSHREQPTAHAPPTIKKPPAPRGKRICRRCNAYKPRRAHHCSVCKRCIIKMDHHCPWVNNCVGIGNHKYFLLFVFYTFLSCTYSLTLVVSRFVGCLCHGRLARGHCLDEPGHILNLVGLIVEAILFGLFTCCMMVDQWDVVMTNVTHIDRLKGDTGFGFLEDASRRLGINEVFGSGSRTSAAAAQAAHFRPDWLSPFVRVCFPSSMHDEIMGFCRPCGGMSRAERAKKEDDDHDFELRAGKSPAQV